MLHRVEGIVIRSTEYGEGNVIITLFTADYGKVGVMVRGAKKTKSRHAAVTQLYTYGEYVFYKSGASTLGNLNQADLLDAFPGVRSDLRNSAYAAYFAELVDRMVPDEEASEFLFIQLKSALEAMSSGKDPQMIAFLLEFKLFQFAGISPVVHECASCGRIPEVGEKCGISAAVGGLVCSNCISIAADAIPLLPGAVKLMPLLQRADLRRIGDVSVKKETKANLKQALRRWMDHHADVRLKTRNVLEQIEAVYD